ncbi:DUF6221 family protein [Streptomyces sp. NPDC007100]|uniref:DUF6221 family protein n=1 Tax=Streptomyces sp. NPDC007100 TaxID=3155602 RepID=UPI0033F5A51C
MTEHLVQFLRDRLDEDEAVARAASPGPWTQVGIGDYGWAVSFNRPDYAGVETEDDDQGRADADHIARHDPARVLAEVEAKRRLLVVHAKSSSYDGCATCDAGNDSCGCLGGAHWEYPCDTMKLLALPYADHPDYHEEWRP